MAKWGDISLQDLLTKYNTALSSYQTAQSFGDVGLQQQISSLQSSINSLPAGSTYLRWMFGKRLIDLQNQLRRQQVETQNLAATGTAKKAAWEAFAGDPEGYYDAEQVALSPEQEAELAEIRARKAELSAAMGPAPGLMWQAREEMPQTSWWNRFTPREMEKTLFPFAAGTREQGELMEAWEAQDIRNAKNSAKQAEIDTLAAREQEILRGQTSSVYTPYTTTATEGEIAAPWYRGTEFTPREYAPTPKTPSWMDKYLTEKGLRPLGAQEEVTPEQMGGMMDYMAWARAGKPQALGTGYMDTLQSMPSWMSQYTQQARSLFPSATKLPTRRLASWQR